MDKAIKGILFDLGDTLLDFGKVDITAMFEAGARLAHEYLENQGFRVPSLSKYHRQQLWAIRWNYLKSRFARREFNALDLLGKLGARLGHDLTKDQILELAWLWYKPLRESATVEDGLADTLRQLSSNGMKLGLVSNTFVPGEVLDRHLRSEGLLEFIPMRVYSCDVRYRKPNPIVFRIALERMGLDARDTIFVGDSPQADIRGSNLVGMVSVLKDPAGRYEATKAGARHRIKRVAELAEIVAGYNSPEARSAGDSSGPSAVAGRLESG